jgi:ArsR family transcriptional regulator, lead/cadmium/zinc/bismuth-responsive transcriptional repressor
MYRIQCDRGLTVLRGRGYVHHMNICSDGHENAVKSEESCSAEVVDAPAIDRVRKGLADDRRVASTTAIFSALSDPTRFRLLDALAREELCVCDLAVIAGISQSGVSHQLRVLRDRGLVTYRREGPRAVYRLADDHVRSLIAVGLEHADEGGGG